MTYDPDRHHRRSIRLKGYDYGSEGAYFVTICSHNRECLFGNVVDGKMHLNDAGLKVQGVWDELPCRFPGLELDAHVIMPNHVHGIIVFVGAPLAAPFLIAKASTGRTGTGKKGAASSAPTLGDVVRAFKSLAAMHVNRLLSLSGPLWQRNYYEEIIRSEESLNLIRQYIADNPARWDRDPENPQQEQE